MLQIFCSAINRRLTTPLLSDWHSCLKSTAWEGSLWVDFVDNALHNEGNMLTQEKGVDSEKDTLTRERCGKLEGQFAWERGVWLKEQLTQEKGVDRQWTGGTCGKLNGQTKVWIVLGLIKRDQQLKWICEACCVGRNTLMERWTRLWADKAG